MSDAFDFLNAAWKRGRLAHAYLLVGDTRGAASDLCERLLQLLCCAATDNKPCGVCGPCRQVSNRTWCDLFMVWPEKKSRTIGVEQMRDQVMRAVGQTAFAGGWKSVMIMGADRMNESAANAFLKTLEEPPPHTLFLLLTDTPQNLRPTILSRCQRLDLSDDAPRELEAPWRDRVLALLTTEWPPGPLSAMSAAARLTVILEEMKASAASRVAAEAQQSESDGLDEVDDAIKARVSARYREMRADVLLMLMRWRRDLLVLATGGGTDILHYRQHADLLRARAQHLSAGQALAHVAGIADLGRQLERSLPEEPTLAYWLDRLAGGMKTPAAAPCQPPCG